MTTLEDRKHLFIKIALTADNRKQLEAGGKDALACAVDMLEMSWDAALQSNQELNGDL